MTYLRYYVGVSLVLSGCGLIDSDVTNFQMNLDDKQFSVDASRWQVDQNQAMTFLNTDCSSAPTICMSAATSACPMNCTGTCSAESNRCELGLDVGAYQAINLKMESPELMMVNDKAVIDVTIDSVAYLVPTNTLNVETPAMKVYVAPMSIMDPNDPLAKQIGTIEPVPARGVISAPREMTFTSDGRAALVDIMSTYKNPFNIIVGSQLVMTAGDPVPQGKLDAVVQIKAHAGL